MSSQAGLEEAVHPLRYTRLAMVLHWAIAALILFNLTLGFFMEGFAQPWRGLIVSIHISSGITVLALTVARVGWRLIHSAPPREHELTAWERTLSHVVHFLLYGAMLLMPLTGWAIISSHPPVGSPGAAAAASAKAAAAVARGEASPPKAPISGGPRLWWVLPLPSIQPIREVGGTPGGVEPQQVLHDDFVAWHETGGFLVIALLLLHVAGALKHQFIDRQPELRRMGIRWRTP